VCAAPLQNPRSATGDDWFQHVEVSKLMELEYDAGVGRLRISV